MPEAGQDAILLSDGIALSDSQPVAGSGGVLYADQLGRGESQAETDQQVIVVSDGLAQGPAGAITLGELTGDTALYKGQTATMRIPATNGSTESRDFTVDFFEDGSDFDTVTQTISPDSTATFSTTSEKSDVGCFIYTANDSNEHRVCWLNIDPGRLLADPDTVYLGGSDTTTDLSLKVDVPSSEASSISVTVDIKEEGSVISSETRSISPGDQHRFTTSVTKSEEKTVSFTADITDGASGITVETEPVDVEWTNDIRAVIDLVKFEADPRINGLGETTTISIDAQNTYDDPVTGFTLEFYEDEVQFYSNTQDVPELQRTTYSTTRTKFTPGKFTHHVQDDGPVNISDDVVVTWMHISAGDLEATPLVAKPGETVTISLPVQNPSSEDRSAAVEFEEDGSRIFSGGAIISAGGSISFSTTVTEPSEAVHEYQGFLQDESGTEGPTNTVKVEWVESGIYADWGDGLVKVNPTVVGSFSGWYDYFESEAHHGNEISGRCSVTLLDDGSRIGAAVTYDDGTGSIDEIITASTTFSESVSTAVEDDPDGTGGAAGNDPDSYDPQEWSNSWNRSNTDGGLAVFSDGFDINIGVGLPGYFHNQGTPFTGSIRFVDNR